MCKFIIFLASVGKIWYDTNPKGRDDTKKHPLIRLLLVFLAICLLLLWDSSHRLVTTDYDIRFSNLPEAFDGFTVVQLSDLHGAQYGTDNSRLVSRVAALQPDLIALTGDYIESPDQLDVTAALIRQLSDIAPVTFTSGNHDWASGAIKDLKQTVTDCGGTYLSNEAIPLTRAGETILLVGVEDPNSRADMIRPDALLQQLSAEHPDQFVILQAHRNDFITKYPALPCDLILTGHGHGGVIRLPFIGGLIGTERSLFPRYDAGLFQSGRYTMVVSRGLGDAPLLPRFLNNPEIVSVTLHKK
ncbi:MAG: metallophosphoesterase [Oscillospiraceae bacterium]|nr:metallophosphoesterase [Oscillospiraceae bacterium]